MDEPGPSPDLALPPEARLRHALETAYRFLAKRDRTVAEVCHRLEREDVQPATIDQVIAELRRLDYLDDARYAQRFAEDRRRLDHWGSERIEQRLLNVGVSRDLVAAAVAQGSGGELDAAIELLRRRCPPHLETDRERDRAFGLLVRRGYGSELAYDAIRAYGQHDTAA